jgi:anaerobic ribonucleoside-triphosphate reductase activating protein
MLINVARTLTRSAANGPGERFVLWVQGCPLECPGCWNPDTWPFDRRNPSTVGDLMSAIVATEGIEGVTLTGGEPFAQARALTPLAVGIREAGLSLFVFTGYEMGELLRPEQRALLNLADVVVTGRYLVAHRTFDLPWRGSSNQSVHFLSQRYGPAEMIRVPQAEFHLGKDGVLAATGFPEDRLL